MSDKLQRFALLSVRKQISEEQMAALKAEWLVLLRDTKIQAALREAEIAEQAPPAMIEAQTEGKSE